MHFDVDSSQAKVAGFLLAAVTIGSLVAVAYAASRPRGRSKRLVNRLDRKLGKLEEQLRLAMP